MKIFDAAGGNRLHPSLAFLTTVSLAALSAMPARAADQLRPIAPPAILDPAPSHSWAGFYLGAHGGYGWRASDYSQVTNNVFTFDSPGTIDGIKSKGWVFGGHAGHNWQLGRIVSGLEFDFSASDINGAATVVQDSGAGTVYSVTRTDRVKYLGTARGRLGWLPGDNVLLYGTAGLAWERYERRNISGAAPATFSMNSFQEPIDRLGWVAGVGVEAMLYGPRWIGRLEYLHYDFGRAEYANSTISSTLSEVNTGGRQSIDMVRAGLSYKFDEPASPYAGSYASAGPHTRAGAAVPSPSLSSSWAGFYLGAHSGYGWQTNSFSKVATVYSPDLLVDGIKSSGWIGGGHAGYNWQYGRVVTGFELDASAAGIRGVSAPVSYFGNTDTRADNVSFLATARARLGWLPVESVLLYGTAGLAWERIERTTTTTDQNSTGTYSQPFGRFGWVAGAGGETMLPGSNWIGRLEYLHYDFGAVEDGTSLAATIPGWSFSDRVGRQTIDVVRAGLSYKFGNPAAFAAAPYAKAPVAPAASVSWAGLYAGVHGGYGWRRNDFTQFLGNPPTAYGGIDSKGWVGGGHVGYNWQQGRIVTGLELDGSATGINGALDPFSYSFSPGNDRVRTLADDVKYLGTVRARLGWLPAENVLLYGTAGLAWERVERSRVTTLTQAAGTTTTTGRDALDHVGWVAGAGVETMLSGTNWSARLEYLHYDFGKSEYRQTFTTSAPGDTSYADRIGHQTIDLLRAGISYKLGAM